MRAKQELASGGRQSAGTRARRGLTLLEVIVSMAIFLMALGAIGPLIHMAQDRAMQIQLEATALQKCQSKLSEVIAGAEPLSGQNDMPFSDNPPDENWLWSMDVGQSVNGVSNLWQVSIRVHRQLDNGRKVEVSLSQLIIDPSLRGGPNPPPQASTSSSTGSTTGGTTTGG
jgi:general secretion pathway protein I